jgi:hypothetical protein
MHATHKLSHMASIYKAIFNYFRPLYICSGLPAMPSSHPAISQRKALVSNANAVGNHLGMFK